MVRNVIKAGLLCASFGNVAQAGTDMPDFPNDVTPETAYSVLDSNPSCLLASEALNSDSLNLTEDQQVLVDLTEKVTSTELGRTIVQKNASDNVFYCLSNVDADPEGVYDTKINAAFIMKKSNSSEIDTYLPAAAEEFAHAAQYHTDDHPMANMAALNRFGMVSMLLLSEAQAKIWTEQIVYEYRSVNGYDHSDYLDNLPDNGASQRAYECYVEHNGHLDTGCLQGAFRAMLTDGSYVDNAMRAIGRGNPSGGELCDNISEVVGYIPIDSKRFTILDSDFDISTAMNIYGKKDNGFDKQKWIIASLAKQIDGVIEVVDGNTNIQIREAQCADFKL